MPKAKVMDKPKSALLHQRIEVPLDQIDDNPFNVRLYFHPDRVRELAESIKQIGLRSVPEARVVNGRYQLAFGHMRKRAFLKLNKTDPATWPTMPLDVTDLTDQQMFLISIEENVRRSDVKPIEIARAVENYMTIYPDAKETEIAVKLGVEQGTISNYRRVLKLPKDILDKIDEGKITFTMARELLVLSGLKGCRRGSDLDDLSLMKAACKGIGGTGYGANPATVDGMKKGIYRTASESFHHLESIQGAYYYGNDGAALFDWKTACKDCEHKFQAYETKTQKRSFCTDGKCFEKKNADHTKKAQAEAKAKMAADIAKRIAEEAVKAPKPATETAKAVSESISQEIPAGKKGKAVSVKAETPKIEALREEAKAQAAAKGQPQRQLAPRHTCCADCLNQFKCDGTNARHENGVDSCTERVTEKTFEKVMKAATVEIPDSMKALVSEAAGTRAEILDLNNLRSGGYNLKEGYELLDGMLEGTHCSQHIDNPGECLNECTHGFHFAFDSKPKTGYDATYKQTTGIDTATHYVCTDKKCLGQKKAAYTRKKNAEGQELKNLERAAIKQAVDETVGMDAGRLRVVLLASIQRTSYGNRSESVNWLLEKLDCKPKENYGNVKLETFLAALAKKSVTELGRILLEFSLQSLRYTGDIHDYKIETTEALNLLGIGINLKKGKDNEGNAKGKGDTAPEVSEPAGR